MPPIECAPLRQKPQATRTPQATLARQAILICLLIAALGAWWGQDEDFTIIVIPDTQFYSAGMNGGSPEIFEAQTRWIAENRSALNRQPCAANRVGDLCADLCANSAKRSKCEKNQEYVTVPVTLMTATLRRLRTN